MTSQDSLLEILIAEDNEDHISVLLGQLKQLGYTADVVCNGLQAVEAVEKNHYSLIFMDIRMPVMDGMEATKHIVCHYAGRKKPYIAALTAFIHYHERFLEAGVDEVILKPFSSERLLEVLAAAQARKESNMSG